MLLVRPASFASIAPYISTNVITILSFCRSCCLFLETEQLSLQHHNNRRDSKKAVLTEEALYQHDFSISGRLAPYMFTFETKSILIDYFLNISSRAQETGFAIIDDLNWPNGLDGLHRLSMKRHIGYRHGVQEVRH